MALFLVHPAVDLTLELYVSEQLEEAMAVQWERIRDREVRRGFVQRLEKRLEDVLKDSLDWDLKAPTPSQLAYATVLSAKLGVALPVEARKYRMHMTLFLDEHSKALRATEVDLERGRDVVHREALDEGSRKQPSNDSQAPDVRPESKDR